MTTGADWVDSARRLLDAVRPPAASPDQPHAAAAHGADCRWCPVCQTTAVLRDLAGEPGRTGAPPAGSEGPDDAAADPDDGAAPVTVQRIDIA